MSPASDKELDNPVWYSLAEVHDTFAIDHGDIKFYQPDHCPFGGFVANKNSSAHIDAYALLTDNFYIIGEKPEISNALKISNEVKCLQMILTHKIDVAITEAVIELSSAYADALFELVNLVQPGYIKRKTILLGSYFGIFKNGELVAVAGERMKMFGFTEVSAVCTLPGHTGKGYASQLMAHTMNKIFSENKTPYLHVAESNTHAIKLYEKLGFAIRRKISAWNIVRES